MWEKPGEDIYGGGFEEVKREMRGLLTAFLTCPAVLIDSAFVYFLTF